MRPRSQGRKSIAAVGLQHQRIEHQLAELPVADPGLAGAERLEGRDVDEDRPRAAPLHVVGRGVLEDEALGERVAHQRRDAAAPRPSASRTAIRRDRRRRGCARARRGRRRPAAARSPWWRRCGRRRAWRRTAVSLQALPVGVGARAQRPQHAAVAVVNAAVAVAERPRLGLDRVGRLRAIRGGRCAPASSITGRPGASAARRPEFRRAGRGRLRPDPDHTRNWRQ